MLPRAIHQLPFALQCFIAFVYQLLYITLPKRETTPKNQVNIRMSDAMLKLIDSAVERGLGNDRSEFIRMAVVERLRALGVKVVPPE